jgi:hypothetical protein
MTSIPLEFQLPRYWYFAANARIIAPTMSQNPRVFRAVFIGLLIGVVLVIATGLISF